MSDGETRRAFADKKALVTGGSRGIGRAVCLELARRGADVAFIYHSRDVEAEASAAQIRALGRVALALKADLANAAAVGAAIDRAGAEFGRLDVVVQAAGAMGNWHETAELSIADWDRYMAVAPAQGRRRRHRRHLVDRRADVPGAQRPGRRRQGRSGGDGARRRA